MKKAALTGLLIVSLLSVGFTGVGVADTSNTSDECDFISVCTLNNINEGFTGFVEGSVERTTYSVTSFFDDDYRTSDDAANSFKDTFNERNSSFVDVYNDRVIGGFETTNVVELKFIDDEDDTTTNYLVAEHDGEELSSAEIVNEIDESPDETIEITGLALDELDSEIETFDEEYIQEDNLVTYDYMTKFHYKYITDIDSSIDIQEEYLHYIF